MKRHTLFEDVPPDRLESVIRDWVRGRNAERNRRIVSDRLFNGITFEKLAEKHDMSVRQIKKIIYKYEMIIQSHL